MARSRPSRTRRKRESFQQPAGAAERARQRRQKIKPVGEPKSQTGAKRERRGGFRAFTSESAAELKKVDWPSRAQTFQGVVVVIIACTIVGFYLWGLDQIIRPLVDKVLL